MRARADGQRSSSSARSPRLKPDHANGGRHRRADERPGARRARALPGPGGHDDLRPLARVEAGAERRLVHAAATLAVAVQQEQPQRGARVPVVGLGRGQPVQCGEIRREQEEVDRGRMRIGERLPVEPALVGQRLQPQQTGYPFTLRPSADVGRHGPTLAAVERTGHRPRPSIGPCETPCPGGDVGERDIRYRPAHASARPPLTDREPAPTARSASSVPVTVSDRRSAP